jgi:multiple sugar transport system substrate-binding protein
MSAPTDVRSEKRQRRTALRVLAGAAAAAVLASLAACSSSGPAESSGPVTLNFWTYTVKNTDPAAQAIIAKYHKEHPNVTIKLSEVGGTEQTASKLLAADRADNAPDVVQVEYRALPSLVVSNVVKDITADVASVKKDVDPNIWALTSLDGKVYGVPQDIGPMMMTYRSDLFAQYGVKVPTTWAEYAQAAEQIHAKDPTAYIASFSADQFEFFAAHAAQAGSRWWSVKGNTWSVGIADDASLKTADFWQDLVDRDLVKVEPLLTPEWNAQVNAGKILSWTAAAWVPSVIYSVAPSTAGKWQSAPIPQWTAGDPAVPFQGGSTYLVPKKSKHPTEAAKFAAWLGASPEGSKLLLGLDIFPAGNAGRQATLSHEPPKLMPQQTDFYTIADKVIGNTTIPVTWGPDVTFAASTFSDKLSAAALNKTSFRDVYTATQDAVIADLKKSGYKVGN